jgi:O-antigen ligase
VTTSSQRVARSRLRSPETPSGAGESLRRLAGLAGPAGLVLLLFLQLVLWGGDRREVALAFAFFETGLFALVLARRPRSSLNARIGEGFRVELALFLALTGWVLLQFAPLATGMAAGAWAEVGDAGAATLDRYATAVELAKLLGLGAVFGLGFIAAGSSRGADGVFKAWGLAAAAYAAWSIAGYYAHGRLGVHVTGDNRLAASFFTPNAAAGVFGISAVFGWAPLLTTVRRHLETEFRWADGVSEGVKKAWPWALLVGVNLWAIGLTASRGGALATLIGITATSLALTFGSGRRLSDKGTLTVLGGAGVLLAVLSLLALAGGPLAGRLDPSRIAVTDRFAYWEVYIDRLSDLPWIGFGLGAFSRFNAFMANSPSAGTFWELGAMHNVYLQWIYEAGLGAVLMFTLVAVLMMRTAVRLRRLRESRRWPATALGVSALLLAHGLVDVDLQLVGIAALWSFLLGAGLSAGSERRRGASQARSVRSR